MAYQIKKQDVEELCKEDFFVDNDLPMNTDITQFIILYNYEMYHKKTLQKMGYEYVDENYILLRESDINEFYETLTEEEKEDCYPTVYDFIEEGLSKNGTLEKLDFN